MMTIIRRLPDFLHCSVFVVRDSRNQRHIQVIRWLEDTCRVYSKPLDGHGSGFIASDVARAVAYQNPDLPQRLRSENEDIRCCAYLEMVGFVGLSGIDRRPEILDWKEVEKRYGV